MRCPICKANSLYVSRSGQALELDIATGLLISRVNWVSCVNCGASGKELLTRDIEVSLNKGEGRGSTGGIGDI